jgi:hypothetical protein
MASEGEIMSSLEQLTHAYPQEVPARKSPIKNYLSS